LSFLILRILQLRGLSAVDPGLFQKGAEPGALEDGIPTEAEAKCEIRVQFT